MIDFGSKAALLCWPIAVAAATLTLLVLVWRPALQRWFGRADIAFSLAALCVPFIVVSGAIRVDRPALGVTALVLLALGVGLRYVMANRAADSGPVAGSAGPVVTVTTLLLLGIVAINFTDTTFAVHYDYYHGLSRAVDLAVQGTSPSAWLSQFDPTYWFVTEQGLLPVVDAIEAVLTGGISTGLAQLFLVLTMCLAVRSVGDSMFAQLAVLTLCAALLIDFNNAPRAHVFVGLFGAILCLRLFAGARWAELVVYLVLLLLAKRDGLVLSLALLGVLMAREVMSRFGWRASAAAVAVVGGAAAVVLNSFGAVGGRSPIGAMAASVVNVDWLVLLSISQVSMVMIPTAALILLAWRARVRWDVPAVAVVFAGYVLSSVVLLQGLEQFNFGTIDRKIYYMFTPVLLAATLAASRRYESGAQTSARFVGAFSLVAVILVTFLFYYTPRVATILPYDGYASVLDAHRFVAMVGREFGPKVQLVVSKPTPVISLNRFPEIGLAPEGGISAYIFPYLSALNGQPFSVGDRATYCRAAAGFDGAALLTPLVAERLVETTQVGDRVAIRLTSGYGLVIRRNQLDRAIDLLGDRIVGVETERLFSPAEFHIADPDVQTLERPWGPSTQHLVIVPSTKLTITAGPWSDDVGVRARLTFGNHPLKAWPFISLVVTYRDGRVVEIPGGSDFDPIVDLRGLASMTFTFDERAYAAPFRGHVLVMHGPRILSQTLPQANAFPFCTP